MDGLPSYLFYLISLSGGIYERRNKGISPRKKI